MAEQYEVPTDAGLTIKVFQKSLVIAGTSIYNGSAFNKVEVMKIKRLINEAYKIGKNDKIDEIKEVLRREQ